MLVTLAQGADGGADILDSLVHVEPTEQPARLRDIGIRIAERHGWLEPPEDIGDEDDVALLGETVGHVGHEGIDAEYLLDEDETGTGSFLRRRQIGAELASIPGLHLDELSHERIPPMRNWWIVWRRLGRRLVGRKREPVEPFPVDDGKGDRVEQLARIGVARPIEKRHGRTLLDDVARQHDHHPAAKDPDDRKVVCDEGKGEAELLLKVAQQRQDLGLGRGVEAGEDLVGENELRRGDDGTGDAGALALAARQLVGVSVEQGGGEPGPLERRSRQRTGGAAMGQTGGRDGCGDAFAHGAARIESRERVLENHLQPGAQRAEITLGEVRNAAGLEHDLAGGGAHEAKKGAAQGRLARTGLADDADAFAGSDLEVDAVQHLELGSRPEERLASAVGEGNAERRRLEKGGHGLPRIAVARSLAAASAATAARTPGGTGARVRSGRS